MVATLLALLIAASAPDASCVITKHSAGDLLKFDAHPAPSWSGTPAKPILDTPDKRLFRTALRDGAVKGPNFAGHMTVVEWGCGASCQAWAVVDARTGKVTKLPDADYVATNYVGGGISGLNYRRDSTLLVLAGAPREDMAREGVHSYLWTGKGFREIGFAPRAKTCERYEGP